MKTIIRDKKHIKQTDWHQYPIIVGSICIHLSKYNHSLTKIRSMMSRHGSVSPWIKFHNIWNRKLNAIRHQVLFQMQESFVLQHNTVFTPGIMSRKETCVHEHLLLSPAPGERSGIPAGVFFSAKNDNCRNAIWYSIVDHEKQLRIPKQLRKQSHSHHSYS